MLQKDLSTMPPKKKQEAEDLGAMRAARFGRVKNTLTMGFGTLFAVLGMLSQGACFANSFFLAPTRSRFA